ncbi:MAG: hemolysin [Sphingobacteriaceae bacterium]|nr:hemolysin [Sphingobacteriaceae bacterium]
MDLLLIIIGSLVASAFFSGMEIAFFSANRFRIELRNKQGELAAKLIAGFLKKPSDFIGTILVGNNIALVLYGSTMARLLEPLIANRWLLAAENELVMLSAQTLLSTVVVLLFGEFLPKSIFRLSADRLIFLFALPMQVFYVLFYPIVRLIVLVAKGFLRLFFGVKMEEQAPVFGKNDLDYLVQENSQEQSDGTPQVDLSYFQNALYFNEVKVRECMVHRMEVVAIDKTEDIEELRALFVESEHSKVLVFEESIDNIVGYVHYQAMFSKPSSIADITLPIMIVPETMSAMQLLKQFNADRKSIALVVDELGGTSGIVTVEDLMEEIFGEIEDEHDVDDLVEKQITDSEFVFSARHEIDYLNDKYKLDLPEGDYETLGGLIFEHHASIPDANQFIELPGFHIFILSVSDTRIETVRLLKQSTED